jgi:hypothetical protein
MALQPVTRWRVERAGSRSGYDVGWFAYNPDTDTGAWFTNHAEAVAFATRRARDEFVRDSQLGLLKLAARGAHAAGIPGVPRTYRRVTDTQLLAAVAMRANGRTFDEIGDVLGLDPSTIRKAVRRAREVR